MCLFQSGNVILIAMETLAASNQFGATEQQVERVGILGALRIRIGVKGTFAHGIASNIEEVASKFAARPLAQPALVLWREVRLTTDIDAVSTIDPLLSIGKMDVGDLIGHNGHRNAQEIQFGLIVFAETIQNARQQVAQKSHDGEMVLDEAHLQIQADIFIEMTSCIVSFGAKDGANLEDALEDAHHDLLVELGALSQVSRTTKVVQLEDVSTAFGSGGNDLGSRDLGKAALVEHLTKTAHHAGSQA